MSYEKIFTRILKEEAVPVTPSEQGMPQTPEQPQEPTDTDVWNSQNPEISNNPEMNSKFETQGLDQEEIEKYSKIINQWVEGVDVAIRQLGTIIKFSASERLQNAPGSEQFNELIKIAPDLKKDLSSFRSQVEDLEQIVKLAIRDAGTERKEKIQSLRQ